jgi:hypothetical protein
LPEHPQDNKKCWFLQPKISPHSIKLISGVKSLAGNKCCSLFCRNIHEDKKKCLFLQLKILPHSIKFVSLEKRLPSDKRSSLFLPEHPRRQESVGFYSQISHPLKSVFLVKKLASDKRSSLFF